MTKTAAHYPRALSIALLSLIAVYSVAAVGAMLVLLSHLAAVDSPTSPGQSADAGQGAGAQAVPPPGTVGIVEWRGSRDDARAQHAAGMFSDYFTSINNGRYQQAAEFYDPALLDASQPDQVETFRQGVSTTTDHDIVLQALQDDTTGKGVVEVRLTFRSEQSAGYGPASNPDETCTLWDITYVLSEPHLQVYRIAAVSQADHEPC